MQSDYDSAAGVGERYDLDLQYGNNWSLSVSNPPSEVTLGDTIQLAGSVSLTCSFQAMATPARVVGSPSGLASKTEDVGKFLCGDTADYILEFDTTYWSAGEVQIPLSLEVNPTGFKGWNEKATTSVSVAVNEENGGGGNGGRDCAELGQGCSGDGDCCGTGKCCDGTCKQSCDGGGCADGGCPSGSLCLDGSCLPEEKVVDVPYYGRMKRENAWVLGAAGLGALAIGTQAGKRKQ